MGKQLFVSHTWLQDDEGRDTHERAKALVTQLMAQGWTTWFDEIDMKNNIDSSMASGIDESDVVLVLLTRQYARKINRAAQSQTASNDSCLKEFAYALFRQKDVVPVVFERCMLNPGDWSPGVVPMRLSMTMYVDGTGSASDTANLISRVLRRKGYVPRYARPRSFLRQKSRHTPIVLSKRPHISIYL